MQFQSNFKACKQIARETNFLDYIPRRGKASPYGSRAEGAMASATQKPAAFSNKKRPLAGLP
jgi:hypothetical protein